jgi:hypothetical protein
MSIEAINEQLLRAIGVGVALIDLPDLRFRFHDDTFAEWFGAPDRDDWLDIPAAKLTDEDGAEVPLTAMEFALLKLFAENRGRVLNRDQILEGAHDPFDRSIDIRISRIRRKIEANPEKPTVIRTVRGIGYVYDPK